MYLLTYLFIYALYEKRNHRILISIAYLYYVQQNNFTLERHFPITVSIDRVISLFILFKDK
jgi:hypothetical protein